MRRQGALRQRLSSQRRLAETANRYSVLYTLRSDAVREHLGLRGYFMQLKIERCATPRNCLRC